jgi:hypothetical protein
MKQILVGGCLTVLVLIVMDTNQVVKTPSGLIVKGGQAFAADMAVKAPPVAAPVGKGKAPIVGKGKGKGPIVTNG